MSANTGKPRPDLEYPPRMTNSFCLKNKQATFSLSADDILAYTGNLPTQTGATGDLVNTAVSQQIMWESETGTASSDPSGSGTLAVPINASTFTADNFCTTLELYWNTVQGQGWPLSNPDSGALGKNFANGDMPNSIWRWLPHPQFYLTFMNDRGSGTNPIDITFGTGVSVYPGPTGGIRIDGGAVSTNIVRVHNNGATGGTRSVHILRMN
tara:strand:- start:1 stop:633 length:633 start_codon:yes stop_codon:yes gene_type:complete